MAFKRFAKALVEKPNIAFDQWTDEIRKNLDGIERPDHVNRVARTVLRRCDPKQYLLSHATIVASVDTQTPKGIKTGKFMNRGVQCERRWPDFRIDPRCQDLINNNGDAWSRPLLLSTYKTFVGANNYCFAPDTKVLMSDGTQRSISAINVGDIVIGGSGFPKKVVHKHERDYDGEVKHIYVGHRLSPITCTPNHPFFRLDRTECVNCGDKLTSGSRPSSYRQRLTRQFCKSCGRKNHRNSKYVPEISRVRADDLEHRAILFAPIPKLLKPSAVDIDAVRFAKLMGFYLSEGCATSCKGKPTGVIFTVGTHETDLIQSILDVVRSLYPGTLPSIKLSDCSDNCTQIFVYNAEMSRDLVGICGKLAHGKKISSEWLNSASPEEILSLIGAYVSGDADIHKTTQRVRACSVSLDLLQQIQFLGSRTGLSGFIVEHGQKVGESNFVLFKDGTTHEIISRHQAHVLHFDVASSKKICGYTTKHKFQKRPVATGDLKFFNDKKITFINKIESDSYSGKVYNLEVEDDHSYIIDGTVLVANCEHIQIPALSKGFIVDAIARDLGRTCYIDILVATDRKHTMLVGDIEAGRMNSMSMGCISLFTICTKCGNLASDDSQLCPCITVDGKGSKYLDENGAEHIVSELIGHVAVPNSNQFIEASWVKNPAFKGAQRRNFLNHGDAAVATMIDGAAKVYDLRRDIIDVDLSGVARAASTIRKAEKEESPVPDERDEMDTPSNNPSDDSESSLEDSPTDNIDDIDAGLDDAGASSGDNIDAMLGKAQEMLLETLVQKLSDKLAPKPEDVGTATPAASDVLSGNDNIVRSSEEFARRVSSTFRNHKDIIKWATWAYRTVHVGGLRAIKSARMTPQELIVLSWIEDTVKGQRYPADLYKLSMRVGPAKSFPSEASFLASCRLAAGRSLSGAELSFMSWKGKIASLSVNF